MTLAEEHPEFIEVFRNTFEGVSQQHSEAYEEQKRQEKGKREADKKMKLK